MNKKEFVELLKMIDIPLNEGESSAINSNRYPRIVFWDYIWEDKLASDETYTCVETYQVSFFSREPRDEKLLELRNLLRKNGLHPQIFHELVEEKDKNKKYYHSYFSVELVISEDDGNDEQQ